MVDIDKDLAKLQRPPRFAAINSPPGMLRISRKSDQHTKGDKVQSL